MKIHYKEIEISKGERTSKLHAMANLMNDLDRLFETVDDEEAKEVEKLFGGGKKIISKDNYRFKLTVEKV